MKRRKTNAKRTAKRRPVELEPKLRFDGQIVVRAPDVWLRQLRDANVDVANLVRRALHDAVVMLDGDAVAS